MESWVESKSWIYEDSDKFKNVKGFEKHMIFRAPRQVPSLALIIMFLVLANSLVVDRQTLNMASFRCEVGSKMKIWLGSKEKNFVMDDPDGCWRDSRMADTLHFDMAGGVILLAWHQEV